MSIRLLPDGLINRIAAGEVIERPASVVKELVENSIDAGATQIDVSVREGGSAQIEVVDNGEGIHEGQLELALSRHATSKLDSEDKLSKINTLGFRGEALPSIASVSRLTIVSRKSDSENAWSLSTEAGVLSDIIPAARLGGTTVSVNDLFYATPARLKFLKTARTELGHISDMLSRLAMARDNISFSLMDGEREVFRLPLESDLVDKNLIRISSIIGRSFAENSIKLEAEREGVRLTGYISIPTFNRSTSVQQYFFVNGRSVRDKLVTGAIRGAYQNFLSGGRHPLLALFVELPPEEVDVNVHPAKTEVRFRNPGLVRGLIVSSIKLALEREGHRSSTNSSKAVLNATKVENQQQSFADAASAQRSITDISQTRYPASSRGQFNTVNYNQPFNAPSGEVIEELVEDLHEFPLGAARGQVHETYIISQTKDGFVIVDQHAAHERIVFERMKSELASGNISRQMLLLPEVVELEEAAIHRLVLRTDEFSELGLVFEQFGKGAIIVREIPDLFGEGDIKGLIFDLAQELVEFGASISLNEKLSEVCSSIACHGSVRAGRKLKAEEMNSLLRQMEATPHSGQCNHGRPTYVELKLKDIERLFGRR